MHIRISLHLSPLLSYCYVHGNSVGSSMHSYEADSGCQAAIATDLIQLQLKTMDSANEISQGNSFVMAEELSYKCLSYECEIETKRSGLFQSERTEACRGEAKFSSVEMLLMGLMGITHLLINLYHW